jgi:DNA-binding NtrC family response regulator
VTRMTSLPKFPGNAHMMIASPNPAFRQRLRQQLGPRPGAVTEAVGGADALAKLEASPCALLLLDRGLADLYPEELVELLRIRYPHLEVILLDSNEDAAVEPARHSAPDADKPAGSMAEEFSVPEELPEIVPGGNEEEESEVEALPGMIGTTGAMKRVFRLARLVARRQATVLVTGETGTGKELVAQAIHELSPRAKAPFVAVNCAAIPETLIEAELFGHVRGAFTGAVQASLGRIHAAHGGTLFLDEAGDLPFSVQTKLLRFLQHGEVQRLGSPDVFRVDVRVVAATNADLVERVARKEFRSDLYYRLAVFPIELPPLRERVDDIIPLAQSFISRLGRESGYPPKKLSPGAQALLRRHSWPGNVRELQHAIERSFILAEDREEIFPELLRLSSDSPSA